LYSAIKSVDTEALHLSFSIIIILLIFSFPIIKPCVQFPVSPLGSYTSVSSRICLVQSSFVLVLHLFFSIIILLNVAFLDSSHP